MKSSLQIRNFLFIALGIFILLYKRHYYGLFADLAYNQGSNFSVSFAIYLIGLLGFSSFSHPRLLAAIGALLAVELFELLNGFGVMANVYDPWDVLANALGIGLALGIALLTDQLEKKSKEAVSEEEEL
jgi:hypothetical protein